MHTYIYMYLISILTILFCHMLISNDFFFCIVLLKFPVHSIILRLSLPEIDWSNETTPLSGLEEDVLQAVLHYLYCECLPPGLTDATAKACLKNMSKVPGFLHFCQLCETFRQNTALKRRELNFN